MKAQQPKRKTDRYIRYGTVKREFIDLPNSTFRDLVTAGAFGPDTPPTVRRINGTIYIKESRLVDWIEHDGKSAGAIIHRQTQRVIDQHCEPPGLRPVAGKDNGTVTAGSGAAGH